MNVTKPTGRQVQRQANRNNTLQRQWRRQPWLEVLEDRSLPSVTLPFTPSDDIVDTDAGNAVQVNVLVNDFSPNGRINAATLQVATNPAHGTTTVDHSLGAIIYTPAAGFSGTDTFTYTVADVAGMVSSPGHVTVIVNRPTANDDFTDTDAGNPVVINVLANDTDPDGNDKIDPTSVTIISGPSHGSATVDPSTGAITYTPQDQYSGTDDLFYTVKDVANAVSNPARVSIVVNRPTANDDFTDTDAGNPVDINVLANDTDPDGNDKLVPSSVTITSGPSHGIAVVNPANSVVTYTPADGYSGTDSFFYTVKDVANATSNPAQVSIVVNRPSANDDFAQTPAGTGVLIKVLANDTDPDGNDKLDPTTVTVTGGPAHGGTSVNPTTGEITYTPNAGFSGTDTFTYTVKDVAHATSNPATVSITVLSSGTNQLNDDSTDTDAGNAVSINVLANDSATGGFNVASLQVASAPSHGSAVVQSGAILYTPAQGFAGTDSFNYSVATTGGQQLGPATVHVVVNRPTANDDFTDTDAGNAVIINVLANDTDPDGNNQLNPTSVTVTTTPSHGSVSVDPTTGAITYTPVDGFEGTDTFNYTVADFANAVSNPAKVTVVVNRPTANDDFTDTDAGNGVTINVLANDTDPDGNNKLNPATVTITTGPAHGSVTVDPSSGAVTYTPVDGFSGTDGFFYTVKDVANATSNPAHVTIVVNRPTANNNFAETDGVNPVSVAVLANDTDPDGNNKLNPATVTVASGPAHGAVAVDPSTGNITYTANAGFSGTDSFTYTVKDLANATSNPATVSIVVHLPTANFDTATAFGTLPTTIAVLANDTDPDGPGMLNPASIQVVTGPSHGSVTVNPATGAITYSAAAGYVGNDVFAYTVADVHGAVSQPAAVLVNVHSMNLQAVGAPLGAYPNVRVFDRQTGKAIVNILPFGANFGGGIRAVLADVNGDGIRDILVSPLAGGASRIRVFDGATGLPLANGLGNLTAFTAAHTGGINLAVGDVNGDGVMDVLAQSLVAGNRSVRIFNGLNAALLASYDAAPGSTPVRRHVRVFGGLTVAQLNHFFATHPKFRGGFLS
jgi:hypothetical protein